MGSVFPAERRLPWLLASDLTTCTCAALRYTFLDHLDHRDHFDL